MTSVYRTVETGSPLDYYWSRFSNVVHLEERRTRGSGKKQNKIAIAADIGIPMAALLGISVDIRRFSRGKPYDERTMN